MRKLLVVVGVAAAALFASTRADAQDKEKLLGADLGVLIPVGDLAEATGIMPGALVHFEMPLATGLNLTGRAGYLHGLTKETQGLKFSWGVIPIWPGVKYYFSGSTEGAYVAGELGLNIIRASSDTSMADPMTGEVSKSSNTESEAKIGTNLGGGYRLGALDLRGALSVVDIGHLGDTMGLLFTVGYSFAKF